MLSKESARTPAVPNRFLHSSPMAAVFALVSALSSSSLPGVGPVGMETTEGRISLRRLEPAAHNTGNHAQTVTFTFLASAGKTHATIFLVSMAAVTFTIY